MTTVLMFCLGVLIGLWLGHYCWESTALVSELHERLRQAHDEADSRIVHQQEQRLTDYRDHSAAMIRLEQYAKLLEEAWDSHNEHDGLCSRSCGLSDKCSCGVEDTRARVAKARETYGAL